MIAQVICPQPSRIFHPRDICSFAVELKQDRFIGMMASAILTAVPPALLALIFRVTLPAD